MQLYLQSRLNWRLPLRSHRMDHGNHLWSEVVREGDEYLSKSTTMSRVMVTEAVMYSLVRLMFLLRGAKLRRKRHDRALQSHPEGRGKLERKRQLQNLARRIPWIVGVIEMGNPIRGVKLLGQILDRRKT